MKFQSYPYYAFDACVLHKYKKKLSSEAIEEEKVICLWDSNEQHTKILLFFYFSYLLPKN